MESLHSLLQRQLRKQFGPDFTPPPDWAAFLNSVNSAYSQFEADRRMAESSLELSAQELQVANAELRSVLQALPDLVLRVCGNGKVLAASGGTQSVSALHPRVDQTIRETMPPSVADDLVAALARTLAERVPADLHYSIGTGEEEVFCEARVVPHLSDQVVVIIRDITKRKQAERELQEAHRELLEVSRKAGMAEVATGVLHNVGNVLTSVNVGLSCIVESLQSSKVGTIGKISGLLLEHQADLGTFLTEDPRGRQLPQFLEQLGIHLQNSHQSMEREACNVRKHVEHINDIVSMQQDFARGSGVLEEVRASDLMNDALQMNLSLVNRRGVEVIREYGAPMTIQVEKHKVLQILVNLIRNAAQACEESGKEQRRVTLRILPDRDALALTVADNGAGIRPENLSRVFIHGFTTKRDGHGFGLHSGANAAKEMGGSLSVDSPGPGHGASFTLRLPLVRTKPAELPWRSP